MNTRTHFLSYLAQLFVEREILQTKIAEKIKTHLSCSATSVSESRAVYEIMYKNKVQPDRPQMTLKYGAWGLRAGYLRLKTHTQNV
jgi:hypothetical protein